jgi:thiol-disulfide isomerase/thioredoxin
MKMLKMLLALLLVAGAASAQNASDSLPYKRFPELPPLQLLLGDSSTLYTKDRLPKNKPVLVLFFSPSCSHCQHTTEELVKRKDSLPDMQLVMASFATITEINNFRAKYKTDSLPNTVVGKDIYFLLPPFYGISNLPFLAFYDRKGMISETFEGSMAVPQILERIRVLNTRKK